MKNIIENLVRKKNPSFRFDPTITTLTLISFAADKLVCLARAIVVFLLHFKKPAIVFIARHVRIFNMRNIRIGKWTRLERGVHLNALGKGRLELGEGVAIGSYSQLIISTSFNNTGEFIKIGNNVGIGQFAYLGGSGGLTIGDNCIIGQYFSCHPENHIYEDNFRLIRLQGTVRKPIMIGENCWIGAKVTILAGVTIGAGSVIAAGAVVTRSMPSNVVIGGVPARIIRQRNSPEILTHAG